MFTHFDPSLMQFLKALADNNDRDWFNERKQLDESELYQPDFMDRIDELFNAASPFQAWLCGPLNLRY